ncbi:MAG TPA: acyltransferase [Solirubrobacter sp.]|nr:acyltransferase [Solirubrobacter sp.]
MQTPDAVTPPPGNPRFPLLDPLRAIAALAIVVTHTAELGGFNHAHAFGAWTARLDCGVAVFFVLSAFLLYRPFVRARLDGHDGPRVARYARRRALRILPAYWVAVVALGILDAQHTPGVFGDQWWVYFGLLQSWSKETIISGVGVAWSLSVEMAFYVLLPVYALFMARLLGRRDRDAQARTELALLAASAVVAVIVRGAVHAIWPESVFGNQFPGTWAWFTGGLALAVSSAWLHERPLPRPARFFAERPLACWAIAFALLTLAAWGIGLERDPFARNANVSLQAQHVLYGGLAFFLVAPMVFHDGRRSLPATLLSTRALAWLGLISYGIFLYHQPLVFAFLNTRLWLPTMGWAFYTLLVIAGVTVIAAASYYVVERPLLRLKEPRGGARTRTRAHAVAAKPES